jgi:hypothetical protein
MRLFRLCRSLNACPILVFAAADMSVYSVTSIRPMELYTTPDFSKVWGS